jgi:hypothetical protein
VVVGCYLHPTQSFFKSFEFDDDLFCRNPNIIAPKREYSVDSWVMLGTPALRVLARLARHE